MGWKRDIMEPRRDQNLESPHVLQFTINHDIVADRDGRLVLTKEKRVQRLNGRNSKDQLSKGMKRWTPKKFLQQYLMRNTCSGSSPITDDTMCTICGSAIPEEDLRQVEQDRALRKSRRGRTSTSSTSTTESSDIVDYGESYSVSSLSDNSNLSAITKDLGEISLQVLGHLERGTGRVTNLRLHIDTFPSEAFQYITEALKDNTSIQRLEIIRSPYLVPYRTRTPEELRTFFKIIRGMFQLQELRFWNFGAIPNYRNQEMDAVCNLVYKHPTLTNFQFSMWSSAIPDQLLDSLGTVPSLAVVHLKLTESCALSRLVTKSISLEELYVVASTTFAYANHHALDLMRAIESTRSLRVLDLGEPSIFAFGVKIMAYALRENTTLEHLEFSFEMDNTTEKGIEEANQALAELCCTLYTNTKLQVIKNHSSHKVSMVSSENISIFLRALELSSTIQEFCFFQETPEISSKKQTAIRDTQVIDGGPLLFSCSCGTGNPSSM